MDVAQADTSASTAMSEILFELYGAPSAAFGIDSLFSYNYNNGKNGLVVSSSYTSTHLIPVIESKAMLSHATRINWGRFQSAEFLQKLLRLKYPTFPGKLTDIQAEDLVREHCYVSQDYEHELSKYLDWTGLEDRNHVIQFPFTEQVVVQKTEEELARAAEKRKESGRRLQEQAAKMRLEKLIAKEQELAYYKELQIRLSETTKKEGKRILEGEDFDDEAQLEKRIRELDKSIRKARNKDVGDLEEEENEPPTFPLVDVPDDQLDEEGLKQKRQQRLMKSNYEARQRAKAEKEREKARIAEEERLDNERRENDPETWIDERRAARQVRFPNVTLHSFKTNRREGHYSEDQGQGTPESRSGQPQISRCTNAHEEHCQPCLRQSNKETPPRCRRGHIWSRRCRLGRLSHYCYW